ncbi:AAA family ATPase [Paenibacillus campi]|uniref:AAA family ATPase n=1 Tax=Paenibacillus campi TaxID=3106031 RepID=UPI002AFF687F|nr:AAA family ATPase [Paenibacillus sp. SGZ-1014]
MTYIKEVYFKNFTVFSELTIPFSKHINIIGGETAVGKTNVLKAIYSLGKTMNDIQLAQADRTKLKASERLTNKLIGVFRPEDRVIGRLVKRKIGNVGKAMCEVRFANGKSAHFAFTNRQTKNVELELQLALANNKEEFLHLYAAFAHPKTEFKVILFVEGQFGNETMMFKQLTESMKSMLGSLTKKIIVENTNIVSRHSLYTVTRQSYVPDSN